MQIHVKTLTEKTITLDVEPSDTILSVKQALAASVGAQPSNQRLVYDRQAVEDEHTLAHYNIEQDAIVYLLMNLCGG